jgi:Mg-chelatase subunit ChlI
MGVNVVEREGISFTHPAQFVLVGTMNPEEGELRPQLLDRFGLAVEIRGIPDPQQRVEIIERRLAFEQDPETFNDEWQTEELKLSAEIDSARKTLPQVKHAQTDLYAIAELTSGLQVDGHRADLVILKSARAHCALAGRTQVTEEDILLAAELALPHRLKRKPFQEVELRFEQLEKHLEKAREGIATEGQPRSDQPRDVKKKPA